MYYDIVINYSQIMLKNSLTQIEKTILKHL